jgi:hypothetical protein
MFICVYLYRHVEAQADLYHISSLLSMLLSGTVSSNENVTPNHLDWEIGKV